jgi:hypothetical protein
VTWTIPEAASPLPLKGAPLADRQSRIRGGRLVAAVHSHTLKRLAATQGKPESLRSVAALRFSSP